MALPLYDPAGTQLTDRQQANPVNADMFGGSTARALAQAGEQIAGLGDDMMQREATDRARDDVTAVTDAQTEGVRRMRHALFDEGGIYTRTGKNAEGMADAAMSTSDTIFQDISKRLNPRAQQAFKGMWNRYAEGIGNAAAGKEMQARQDTRTATKTAALAEITNDVIANYNDEEVLATNFVTASEFIAANADGAPPEVVAQMQRETASALHLAVIQRLTQDDPGRALSYYERHKGQVQGVDHTKANAMISGVSQARDARMGAEEIANGGSAGDIIRSVVGAESGGDAGAVSAAGAAGLMQLMPGTAKEVASSLGINALAGKSDDEIAAYWNTPDGKKLNVRLGTTYLNKQLTRFDGDIETALIAYNAGPENAVKFLNAGRDYSALPKAEETLPYVQRVMSRYMGLDVTGNSSADIQRQIKGDGGRSVSYNGDARGFLLTKLQKQHGPASVDEMAPAMQQRLASMFSEAPDFVKDGLDILSGARSHARQVELFNASDKTGHSVARPGHSFHENRGKGGEAADLGWKGGRFSGAPKEVREWIHANAARYGLKFPMGWEPWHIELKETRMGGNARGPQRPDVGTDRVARAFDGAQDSVRVEVDNSFVNPADVYTNLASPFTVSPDRGSLDGWLLEARERYAGNPSMLAEVERQLTEEHRLRTNRAKEETETAMMEKYREIIQGGKSVRDFDPLELNKLGGDNVKKLLDFEDKWRTDDDDKTDETTYYRLSQMPQDEFSKYDLSQDFDKLSRADVAKLADRQAEFKRANKSPAKLTTDLTRTQIVGMAENMLGLEPAKSPDDAKRMAMLQRALDGKIGAFVETNKKEPTGPEMQAMVDELLLSGTVRDKYLGGWILGPERDVASFEMTPEERASVTVADSFDEVPPEAHADIARGYRNIWQTEPNEDAAVDFYNDMARVKFGGAPLPPAALDAKIRQGLTQTWGRAPTVDEVASFYREWIIRATAAKQ